MAIIEFDCFHHKAAWNLKTIEEFEAECRAKCEAAGGEWVGASTGWQSEMTLFSWKTYVGRCVADREVNGYDDSDFYMTVYEDATDSFRSIMFATTRGWTYPAMGSSPDATPEVLEKYKGHLAKLAEADRIASERIEDVTPTVGKTVEVIKGRKVPKGTTGLVFWLGPGTKYTPNFGYSKHQTVPNRLGIKDAAGKVYWTSAANVQVI